MRRCRGPVRPRRLSSFVSSSMASPGCTSISLAAPGRMRRSGRRCRKDRPVQACASWRTWPSCSPITKPDSVSAVRELANRYVDQSAVLDPILATSRGVTGYDGEMTDYSPEGHAARTALDRKALADLSRIRPLTEPDRIAVDVMTERLQVAVDQEEAGERLRGLRLIGRPCRVD